MSKVFKSVFFFFCFIFLIKNIFFLDKDESLTYNLKSFFTPFIEAYLLIFQNENTSLFLFLLIIASCIISLYWIYFDKYMPLRKKLDASIELADSARLEIYGKKRTPLEGLLELEQDEFLRPFILKYEKRIPIKATDKFASASSYINLGLLETKGFPLKIISSLPGYFVGLGLIFTFLGLVAALYFCSQGMKTGNYEDARSSMMHLLYAASFKFTTSIAGVSSSLAISVLYKSLLHALHLRIENLSETLDDIFYASRKFEYNYADNIVENE